MFFLGGAMVETQHDQWVRWYAYNSMHINTWHPQIVFLCMYVYIYNWLVVLTIQKNMKVSFDDYSQYMGNMFQTTNQLYMICYLFDLFGISFNTYSPQIGTTTSMEISGS